MGQSWLIIGHGSVGSSLVTRLLVSGSTVYVYDPRPRVPFPEACRVLAVNTGPVEGLGYVAVCVPAAASLPAARFVRRAVQGVPPVFDWTSALPATKREAASIVEGPWVDVALLDSLDKEDGRALLAVSGRDAAGHSNVLRDLGFDLVVVGAAVGHAAQTKLVRSLFMKGLEALVIEARSIAARLDPTGTAWRSIERNLGSTFAAFADLLVVTDVTHAGRRSTEIGEAVEYARTQGLEPLLASAAVEALARLGALWNDAGPGLEGAGTDLLLEHAVNVFSNGHEPVNVSAVPGL